EREPQAELGQPTQRCPGVQRQVVERWVDVRRRVRDDGRHGARRDRGRRALVVPEALRGEIVEPERPADEERGADDYQGDGRATIHSSSGAAAGGRSRARLTPPRRSGAMPNDPSSTVAAGPVYVADSFAIDSFTWGAAATTRHFASRSRRSPVRPGVGSRQREVNRCGARLIYPHANSRTPADTRRRGPGRRPAVSVGERSEGLILGFAFSASFANLELEDSELHPDWLRPTHVSARTRRPPRATPPRAA